jgi:hypothetical protein
LTWSYLSLLQNAHRKARADRTMLARGTRRIVGELPAPGNDVWSVTNQFGRWDAATPIVASKLRTGHLRDSPTSGSLPGQRGQLARLRSVLEQRMTALYGRRCPMPHLHDRLADTVTQLRPTRLRLFLARPSELGMRTPHRGREIPEEVSATAILMSKYENSRVTHQARIGCPRCRLVPTLQTDGDTRCTTFPADSRELTRY